MSHEHQTPGGLYFLSRWPGIANGCSATPAGSQMVAPGHAAAALLLKQTRAGVTRGIRTPSNSGGWLGEVEGVSGPKPKKSKSLVDKTANSVLI